MKIGFIGAGRMGFTLGKYLAENGISVGGFYSRNPENAAEAAKFTDTLCYENMYLLAKENDIIFLTVSDGSIETVYKQLETECKANNYDLTGKIIAHTSGALSTSVFTDSINQRVYFYSIHPIYAVSDRLTSYKNFQNAFITIEGHDKYLGYFTELFEKLGNKTRIIAKENKVKYHSAAVFASNYVVAVYAEGMKLLMQCGFDEESAKEALSGLFTNNAMSVAEKGPYAALTGPVDRNDITTVTKHLNALSEYDREVYKALARITVDVAKVKNKDTDYTELMGIIE